MLSKLHFFSHHDREEKDHLRNEVNPSEVLRSLDQTDFNFLRLAKGTLSASFLARAGDTSIFLKNPITSDGAANLHREAKILRHLYCDLLHVECVVVETAGMSQHWLVMSELEHYDRVITPVEIHAVLGRCMERLNCRNFADTERPIEIHRPLMAEAYAALSNLTDRSLIDRFLYDELYGYLRQLDEAWADLPKQLCHGDLGPENIMHIKGHPVIIDWEDLCVGFSGYDYLYWLTFMTNRQFYGDDMWQKTPLPNSQIERAVMIATVLLKTELASRSGGTDQLKLPPSVRLMEILDFGEHH